MVKKPIIDKLRRFSEALERAGIPIDKMILYGSYAKSLQRQESDIDVAVVSKSFGRDKVEEGMLLFKIAGDVDARIEPVAVSLKSFEMDTWIPLIYEIRKNGIEISLPHRRSIKTK